MASNSKGFSTLALTGAKLTLKVALNMLLNNRAIIDHVAATVYQEESGSDFMKLPAADKALWVARVQATIRAVSGTIGV